jgi:hypothetical protein
MSDKKNLSIQDRANLLFKLGQPTAGQPTPTAREALSILDSLQQNTPKEYPSGRGLHLKNPVTGIDVQMAPRTKGNYLLFQNTDSSFNRPSKLSSKIMQLGIRATVNQMIDEIPTARGDKRLDSRYTFEPLDDSLEDTRFKNYRGKTNARNKAYDRFTKGAFKAYPRKNELGLAGYGNRISEDTWQPRTQGGKYGKYVKFDTTDVVRRLGKAAVGRAVGIVPRMGPYMQSLMIGDQLIEGVTGTSPYKSFVEYTKQQFAKEDPKKPETWVPRPMTLMIK